MRGEKDRGQADPLAAGRPVVYCVVPSDLAPRLHEPLRRFWAENPDLHVVVERRGADRREGERRSAKTLRAAERRRIRNPAGRRVGERRASVVQVGAPALPRKAARFADRLVFIERIALPSDHAQELDSARLVVQFQGGRQQSFADLYLRYFDHVYNYLRLSLGDEHEAEDATQQVFIRVLEALPDYEQRGTPFRAWLFTVVRNHALNLLKRRNRLDVRASEEIDRCREEAAPPSPEELPALNWITDQELLLFLDRLPLAQRQVIMLRYMLGLKPREIAEVLDRSYDDVRMLHSRALRFLRDRLTALGRKSTHGPRARMRGITRKARVLRSRRYALLG